MIAFQAVVPLLCRAFQVEGCDPDFLIVCGVVRPEELAAFVEPRQQVIQAIIGWKAELVADCSCICMINLGQPGVLMIVGGTSLELLGLQAGDCNVEAGVLRTQVDDIR